MRVLIIDNYDSFTFNLYQYTGEILFNHPVWLGQGVPEVIVKRNNELTLSQIEALAPNRIIISPGPGSPDDTAYFGVCSQVITQLGPQIPTLGVCLGMQGIAHVFGGQVVRAPVPMHGKISPIAHNGQGVFSQMPQHLNIMRYHSLMAQASSLPDCLSVTAVVSDGVTAPADLHQAALQGQVIMGIKHRQYPIEGIQFHPESFATEGAKGLLENFLRQA
jgi:anthranilate synthase/aminodeoxychorismate synthase-like glutamine amidotransferase